MRMLRGRSSSGFTLIELMMVVAILGILAVIAIPKYKQYVYRSKTAEAIGFLAEIKSRQESYRADYGTYCNVSGDNATWWPTGTVSDKYLTWPVNQTSGVGANWAQLGAIPPGNKTLFQYNTYAGTPATAPTSLGFTTTDFWFVSRARADLDNNGTTVLFEGYSASQGIYIDKAAGWD